MTSGPRTAVSLLIAGAGLCACGVPNQARNSARLLTAYTQTVQREAEEFAGFRDALARARTRNIDVLEESAVDAENRLASQLHIWSLSGDRPRIDLYRGILEGTERAAEVATAAARRREESERQIRSARSRVRFRQDRLGKVATSLAQLAEKPDLKEQAGFYVGFFKEVRKRLDELKKTAQEEVHAGGAR